MKDSALPCPSTAMQTLAPKPPRERPGASRSLRRPLYPLFGGPGRLVMGTDRRAIRKNHARCRVRAPDLFRQVLPDTGLRPANEQLCGNPPRTKPGWQDAPLCAVLMAPENRRYRPSKVLRRGLALRVDFLDQRLPDRPDLIRKTGCIMFIINSCAACSVI